MKLLSLAVRHKQDSTLATHEQKWLILQIAYCHMNKPGSHAHGLYDPSTVNLALKCVCRQTQHLTNNVLMAGAMSCPAISDLKCRVPSMYHCTLIIIQKRAVLGRQYLL